MENIQIKIEALKLKHARLMKQCDVLLHDHQIAHASGAGSTVREIVRGVEKCLDAAINIENQIAELGNTHIN